MKALTRLERFIQELVERPAWLLTNRRIHPIALASALTKALEDAALPIGDRVIAPDSYAVRLHPDDYEQFASVRQTLEREFGEYVARLATERDLTLASPVTVMIVKSRATRAGEVAVTTHFSDPSPGATLVARTAPPPLYETEVVAAPRAAALPATEACLEAIDARGAVLSRHPLGNTELVIGRRSSNGLSLPDPQVSRRHARIERAPSGYLLHDLGSMNGTTVNGRAVRGAQRLADGDIIMIGGTRLRFRSGG